jgi:hypothetical protein
LTGIGEFRGLAAVLLVVYDLGLLEVEAVESQVLSVIAITQLRSGVPVVTWNGPGNREQTSIWTISARACTEGAWLTS